MSHGKQQPVGLMSSLAQLEHQPTDAAEPAAAAVQSSDAICAKLRNWLVANNEQREKAESVVLDTNLLEEGVLDSLEMVNFIIFIEDVRGNEIPESLMQPERFKSLRVIRDTFFD